MDLLISLNHKFQLQYGKHIAELNKNIYISPKNNDGNYEAPVIKVGSGGGAIMKKDSPLPQPAVVSVETKKLEPAEVTYRIALPRAELEIADKSKAYFTYFFDRVLQQALNNYAVSMGKPEALRFGSYYIQAELTDFLSPQSNVIDNSDFLELRLTGSWASDTEVV